jgi:colanic acid/amylovoran biosynthesis glycosyltransferase
VIGGDGPLMQDLARQADQLGAGASVLFSGQVAWDEVPAFLASADVFVLPSVRDAHGNVDGLPTVLLEAMSSGVAVAASDIAGVPLVVRHGENGLLVAPGDVSGLAVAIGDLIDQPDLRGRLARAARESVVRQFNWAEVARRLESLYASVAATARRRNGA